MSYGNGNDYSNNAYGGGAGGGGGYLSQGVGGSQASPSSTSKDKKAGTIRPVTIKQILDCNLNHQFSEHNSFKIDGTEILHVTIVARVRSVTDQSTHITYVVDDGTGQSDVKQWVDSDTVSDGSSQNLQNQYIRIVGQLREFNNKRSIVSHAIRAVTDYNEVQYHLLEATAMHLYFTRGPPPVAGDANTNTGYGAIKQDTQMSGMGGGMGGGMASGVKHEGDSAKLPPGTSQAARTVWETIRSQAAENNEGMHVQVISQRSNLNSVEVQKAVDELLTLGAAFTTLDDEHVAVMDF